MQAVGDEGERRQGSGERRMEWGTRFTWARAQGQHQLMVGTDQCVQRPHGGK